MARSRLVLGALTILVVMAHGQIAAGEGSTLTFFVYQNEPRYPLQGASVLLISRSGSRELGVTDQLGEYRLRKADLRGKQGLAVLFCFQGSSTDCSAVRLEDGKVLGFEELAVNLPLPKTVDRFKVDAKRK